MEDDSDDEDQDEIEDSNDKDNSDERLVTVSDAIQLVEPPGDFFTCGECSTFPFPSIVVDGVGDIALPLTDMTATVLMEKCHLAPYGLGEQTIVDTQVRNTWELSPTQFRIENPQWKPFVDEMVESCRAPLGIAQATHIEAKLYKMLLYESGGKFEKHQDSEKEDGMFGTLVVILPCRFEGGEFEVHDPVTALNASSGAVNMRVWEPAKADVFVIKYAAFYETDETIEAVPRFTGSFPLYEALKASLCDFFTKPIEEHTKRAKTSEDGDKANCHFDLTDPSTYRRTKFVYALTHKYTQAGLDRKYLKNKDALVAESLVKVCRESNGALGLYLCKARYEFEWRATEGTDYVSDEEEEDEVQDPDLTVKKELHLSGEWVGLWTRDEHTNLQMRDPAQWDDSVLGDLSTEVAPVGFFGKELDMDGDHRNMYTGNEGSVVEKWYNSAALVVLPLVLRYKLSFAANPEETLKSWANLVDRNPSYARVAVEGIAATSQKCSLTAPEVEPVFQAVKKLSSLSIVRSILLGCEFVEFQPKLRDLVTSFNWNEVVAMVKRLPVELKNRHVWKRMRSSVNLVVALLEGETDKTKIESMLNEVELKNEFAALSHYDDGTRLDENVTTPEEYARVLKLASTVSMDLLTSFLEVSTTTLVLVAAPALVFLVKSHGKLSTQELQSVVEETIKRIETSMPELRQLAYKDHHVWCPDRGQHSFGYYAYRQQECDTCNALKTFLHTASQTEIAFTKRSECTHVRKVINKSGWGEKVTVEHQDASSASLVIKKTHEGKMFRKGSEIKQALGELLE